MRERIVGISKENKAVDYIKDFLIDSKKSYKIEEDDNQIYFLISDTELWLESLISEVIVLFYKFNEISKLLMPNGNCPYPYCAYIGSILSIDAGLEKDEIKDVIPKDNFISIDGIYNFCLKEIRESWESLAHLCNKLVSQCKCDKDLYALTSFMLGVETGSSSTLTVDRQDNIELIKDGESIKLPNFFNDPEMDAITTILANSPSEILIVKKEAFSQEFMNLMHKIGV
jgi:hypothetical protein